MACDIWRVGCAVRCSVLGTVYVYDEGLVFLYTVHPLLPLLPLLFDSDADDKPIRLLPSNKEQCSAFATDLKKWLEANAKRCQTTINTAIRAHEVKEKEEETDFNNLAMRAAKQFRFPEAAGVEAANALKIAAQTKEAAQVATNRAKAAAKAMTEAEAAAATAMAEAEAAAATAISGAGATQAEVQEAQAAAQAATKALQDAEERAAAAEKEAAAATATATEAQKDADKLVNVTVIILVAMF